MATPTCLNPVTTFNPTIQYFPQNSRLVATDLDNGGGAQTNTDTATVEFADLFEVTYHSHYKVVKTIIPGKARHEYVLYQCGTPQPESDTFWSNATFFQVPVTKAATSGSIPAAFMEDLDLDHRLHVVDGNSISSSCILKQAAVCEGVTHFSAGRMNSAAPDAAMTAWRYELESNDDIGVVFTDFWGTGQSNTAKDVAFDASLDKGILESAEWLKFVSLFFNAEAKANEVFLDEVNKVEEIHKSTKEIDNKPSVAWSTVGWENLIYGTEYRQDFITMGGGVNAFTEKITAPNTTALMDTLKGIQVLIDETYAQNPHEYTKATFFAGYGIDETMIASGDWPFLTNDMVFRVDKHHGDGTYNSAWGTGPSYPLEWYARRTTNPNEFVSDVAYALHPTMFPESKYFLRNIMKGEPTVMNTAADCTEDCATDGPTGAPTTTASTAPDTTLAPTAGGANSRERLTVLPLMMAGFALAVARFL